MAATLNDRDILLSNSAVRLVQVSSNYISLSANYGAFDVVGGVATPSSIQITATLNGFLTGIPQFSVVSGSSGILQSTIDGKAVATLTYSSLTSNSAVLRATLVYLGVTYTTDIEIAGQTVKPANIQNLNVEPFGLSAVKLRWNPNIDADLAGYEVRTTDSGWGSTNGFVFKGQATSCIISGTAADLTKTWYVRAYDTSGLYSASSAPVSYVPPTPGNVTDIYYEYADTSLTNATVTLRWDPVTPVFGLKEYELSYLTEGDPPVTLTLTTRANSIVLPANWVGSKSFTLKTRDNLGSTSSGFTKSVVKYRPNPPTNFKGLGIDSMVQLRWNLPDKTSLPISHVILKKGSPTSTWETATPIGIKDGEFTTDQEYTAGSYVYWIATVDTDNIESDPVATPITLTGSADFVFIDEFVSELNGTLTNGIKQYGSIIVPVNTTETYAQHFTNNGWTTPQSQVSAKYPVYIQPGTSTAVYEEVFDYGNGSPLIVPSSSISVSLTGRNVIGDTNIGILISTSTDGISYSQAEAGNTAFGVNFRFVKVRLAFTRGTGDGVTNIGSLYELNGIKVSLSTKLKTDAGVTIVGTSGTFVNFNREFLDVTSIGVTASGTLPRICTYNFKDEILTASYSIVSNVLTATLSVAHDLVPGMQVRLSSGDGKVSAGLYIVLSTPSSTQFTVSVSSPNGSGTSNLFVYHNSMMLYVYDTNGTPQEQKVSWTVRGA